MAQKPGGRIPNQGNPPQAKGIGKNSKRHDLERRAVPTLHGSDLQQGDVSRLEQSIRTAPIKEQQPSRGQAQGSAARMARPAQGTEPIPNALDFIGQRAGGTLGPDQGPLVRSDSVRWAPLLRELTRVPGTGGLLVNAYISQLSSMMQNPMVPDVYYIDLNAAEDGAARGLGLDDGQR